MKFWLLFIPIGLFGCSRIQTEDELKRTLANPEHGFVVRRDLSDLTVTIQYDPFLLTRPNGQTISLTEDSQLNRFILSFTGKAPSDDILALRAGSEMEYQSLKYYFSYSLQEDIYLVHGNKRYPCALFLAESNGKKNSMTFLLGFEKCGNEMKDFSVVVDSRPVSPLSIPLVFKNPDYSRFLYD